jgi:hypothetical protein
LLGSSTETLMKLIPETNPESIVEKMIDKLGWLTSYELDLIKNALETVSFLDVEEWKTEVFGRSTLSKRQILFSTEHEDTKTV